MADALCRTCPFWAQDPPRELFPGEVAAAVAANGACRFSPEPRPCRADHWCGQHPLRQRDALAARAMDAVAIGRPTLAPDAVAELAYSLADALLAEAAKGTP